MCHYQSMFYLKWFIVQNLCVSSSTHQDESLLQYLSWQNCLLPFKLSKYVILQQKKVKLNKLGSISNSVWVYLDLQNINEWFYFIIWYENITIEKFIRLGLNYLKQILGTFKSCNIILIQMKKKNFSHLLNELYSFKLCYGGNVW